MAVEILSRDNLQTAEAVLGLGMAAVRALQEKGSIALFINEDGAVEVASLYEVMLDAIAEDDAIAALLEKDYSEDAVLVYLKGREARMKVHV